MENIVFARYVCVCVHAHPSHYGLEAIRSSFHNDDPSSIHGELPPHLDACCLFVVATYSHNYVSNLTTLDVEGVGLS
jgi:hypothetical protein